MVRIDEQHAQKKKGTKTALYDRGANNSGFAVSRLRDTKLYSNTARIFGPRLASAYAGRCVARVQQKSGGSLG